jgi:hypothetical protein
MKYTEARELVEAALEIVLSEEITSGNSKENPMTKNKMGYKKPSSPATDAERRERAKKWVTDFTSDAKKRLASAVNEESEKEMSTRNIKTYQGHIDRLRDAIDYHSRRKPGWSDRYGNQTQSSINAKVKDLTNIHKELTSRHKKALANHASGNYGANKGHYLLNTDWH